MPISAMNFASLPTEGDPLMAALIPAYKRGIELRYLQPQLQNDLRKQQLTNALMQVDLDYADPMAQANLDYANARTPNLEAQTRGQDLQNQLYPDEIMSQIGLRNAQTDATNMNTRFVPLKTLSEVLNNQQKSSRFGEAYQLRNMLNAMPPAARAVWISENKDKYNYMMSTLGDKALQQQQGIGNDLIAQQIEQDYQNLTITPEQAKLLGASGIAQPAPMGSMSGMPQPQGSMPQAQGGMNPMPQTGRMQGRPQQQYSGSPFAQLFNGMFDTGQPNTGMQMSPELANNIVGDKENMPMGMQKLPQMGQTQGMSGFNTSPEAMDRLGKALDLSANKYLTTTKTQNQLEGAVQLEEMTNNPDFQEKARAAAQYAGALGKGQGAIDTLMNKNPKAYDDFRTFKDNYMVEYENRIKGLEAMGATDSQREELHNLYDAAVDALNSDPDRFIYKLNGLLRSISTVAKSVQKSANPLGIESTNRIGEFKPITLEKEGRQSSGPSQAQLEATAKKYGQTVEQVKRNMGLS